MVFKKGRLIMKCKNIVVELESKLLEEVQSVSCFGYYHLILGCKFKKKEKPQK